MKKNTLMYTLAGIFWAIQTILSLINIFTSEQETISMIIGVGISILYGVCAYTLFVGDTYQFHKSIKVLSIVISIAVGIVAIYILKIITYLPGLGFVLLLLLALVATEYWALTYVSGKADDDESLEKIWIYPGVMYLITIIFSFISISTLENKYGLSMDMASSLISDNLILLVLGAAMFFFTGYAFYDAQKRGLTRTTVSQPNLDITFPDSSGVFGNLYSNNNPYVGNQPGINQSNTSPATNPAPSSQSEDNEHKSSFTLKKD